MKRLSEILFATFVLVVLFPYSAMAQGGDPPPTCCRNKLVFTDDGTASVPQLLPQALTGAGVEVYLPDEVIFGLGLTRREMVDRLATAFFAGKSVDLLIPMQSLEEPLTAYPARERRELLLDPASDRMLVAVQVRRFYQVRKSQVRDEVLDSAEQIFITDGELYVTVNLSRSGPSSGSR
jgi:hypothetical protein